MGATLASLPPALWAHLLSGEGSSGSGLEHALSLSTASDAFLQCGSSNQPPLSHHHHQWEAAQNMDYQSSAHHHYMMPVPPPPNSFLAPPGPNVRAGQWMSSSNSSSPGEQQQQHLQSSSSLLQLQHCSDYQDQPFAPRIVPNPKMTSLLHESPEEPPNRDAKRSAAANPRTGGEEMSGSPPELYKRPRLEQPAAASAQSPPIKTQGVRKEKLGERITALQQLVSPFGKTDTASVLQEAIGYIKFLQDQVQVLSTPYMKPTLNSGSVNHHDSQQLGNMSSWASVKGKSTEDVCRQDLRSRGLCLVPVSCTSQVANDNGADFWTPAIGGGCR